MGGGDVDGADLMSSSSTITGGSNSREGSAEKQVGRQILGEQNNYETIERKTVTKRSRDPGYETIPGEKCRRDLMDILNATQPGMTEAKSRNSAPAGE